MGTELHQRDTTAWRTFTSDLRLALGAWRKAPMLPFISVLFPIASSGAILLTGKNSPYFFAIGGVTWVLQAGWVGTERIWYLRIFRGDTMNVREMLWFTPRYIPSFLILGFAAVLAQILSGVFFIPIIDTPVGYMTVSILLTVMADVALTFVTPSLAYSDFMVTKAIGRGLRMLREHWSHAKYYALVPPLAVAISSQYFAREIGVVGAMSLAVGAGLLNLWFKGATAAYYLRFNEVGRNGRFDPDVGAYIDK